MSKRETLSNIFYFRDTEVSLYYYITIAFDDGKVFGFSGVNRYFGGAVINGEDLDVSNVASTMMAGPQDKMAAEMEYLQLLSEADKIQMEDNKVIITTKDNQELIFEAK